MAIMRSSFFCVNVSYMKDRLSKNFDGSDYYRFITNLRLEKEYYDFCHSSEKVKNIKSVKRKVSCFVRTQPSYVQTMFKRQNRIKDFFTTKCDVFDNAKTEWLDL